MKQQIEFAHVSLVVADTTKSLTFYCDVIGFEQNMSRPAMTFAGAWLDIAKGEQIHLLEVENPDPVANRPEHGGRDRHSAFTIQQLAPLKQRLEEAKVAFTLSQSGRKALFCRDPDGNTLEFIEKPS